jgi:hypothetical protein
MVRIRLIDAQLMNIGRESHVKRPRELVEP